MSSFFKRGVEISRRIRFLRTCDKGVLLDVNAFIYVGNVRGVPVSKDIGGFRLSKENKTKDTINIVTRKGEKVQANNDFYIPVWRIVFLGDGVLKVVGINVKVPGHSTLDNG